MRIAQLLGALGAAAIVAASPSLDLANDQVSSLSASASTELPFSTSTAWSSSSNGASSKSSVVGDLSATTLAPSWSTTPAITPVAPTTGPNATTSKPPEVTGGAIPQQMQASMAGLLGFCIMGLVML